MNTFIEQAAEAIQKHVDIAQLLEKTQQSSTPYTVPALPQRPVLRIAVARDEAFNFLYPENLEALKKHPHYEGRITYFSPLHDPQLPDADLVYLPGGYPELFAAELEQNTSMRHSIADFVERQGLLLGECGGMIYLTEELDGHRMCGVLPMKCTMEQAKLTLGYRRLTLGPLTFFGHEFPLLPPDRSACSALDRRTIQRPAASRRHPCLSNQKCNRHLYPSLLGRKRSFKTLELMRRIYTRTGDKGMTAIHGGTRVSKTDIRIEANGCIDELNVAIGLVRSFMPIDHPWQNDLKTIQLNLMTVMSLVATPAEKRDQNPNHLPENLVEEIESWIDLATAQSSASEYFYPAGGHSRIGFSTPMSGHCTPGGTKIVAIA